LRQFGFCIHYMYLQFCSVLSYIRVSLSFDWGTSEKLYFMSRTENVKFQGLTNIPCKSNKISGDVAAVYFVYALKPQKDG